LILGVPAVDSRASYAHSVLSFSLPGGEQGAIDVFALIAGWTFVAAWAAYGAEMASALSGEVRDAVRAMPRVMALSAAITLLAYTTVPLALIGLVGAAGVAGSPETPFLPPAEVVFGGAGRIVVGLMLTGALVLSAQVFIIASSRTVYQMARDGHLPRTLSRVNRRGVPVGSIVLDASIIAIVLLIFGRDVVEIVAAANVSYLVVFVLLPIAYLALRAHAPEDASAFRMRRAGPLAIFLALFNVALLAVGGPQWGATTMLTGTLLTLLIIPVSLFCRSRASREK
jgi:amino acid transporter